MAKEQMEDKIRRHVTDGFQMDYDREDNLVPVFQKEEVVENIMIAIKEQSIAFRNWEPPIGNYNSDEDLYEIFEQQKNNP